jgi:hypothetical protein
MLKFLKFLKFTGLVMLLFSGLACEAQSWVSGFRYRKLITIDKNKVEPVTNAPYWQNFYVLIQLEDPDLRHLEDVFENKITNPQGLDISFSSAARSNIPLSFQLESYHPETGKLVCWVLLPELVTRTSSIPTPTSIYFYYGSATLHQPDGPAVKAMWQPAYHHVQPFNEGAAGMIGSGKSFNGVSDKKLIAAHPSAEYTLSAWIKLNQRGKEQMIITNDSTGAGSYQLKVNTENKLEFVIKSFTNYQTFLGSTVLDVDGWHFVNISYKSAALLFLLDGVSQNSKTAQPLTTGLTGQVVIGASKVADQYFNGVIDDLKISKTNKLKALLTTEYVNQSNPAAFYTVGTEEVNTQLSPYAEVFTGAAGTNFTNGRNWVTGIYPGNNKNIIIPVGLTADISTDVIINKLKLETGAKINLRGNVQVRDRAELGAGASIVADSKVLLQLEGNLVNNGQINLVGVQSRLLFSGNAPTISYTGGGSAIVSLLEVNRPSAESLLTLFAPLEVKKSLQLFAGSLNANGNLVLLSNDGLTAALHRVPNQASISGNVKVQSFVNGSFPSPATGRGWRLLSSPVVHTVVSENHHYELQAIKNAVFVTGKAGTANGFDASPNNGATIYTHNQSLPGTLAQKYVPIPNMQVQIPLGKGFFVFSRGNRTLPNAYQLQVQNPPFANAEPFIITYTGRLFTGDLMVKVFNNDNDGEGDGFNLLGNPYAAPIKWGSLLKINVGPFIWLYDPLNNNYRVSRDPEELIQPGTGFFIKVNQGSASGFIGFTEDAKVVL